MFSSILAFLAKAVSYIQLPPPELRASQIEGVSMMVQTGDVILCRAHGSFSSLFIPGFWDHVAVAINDRFVVEATTKGVVITNMIDLLRKKDAVSVWNCKAGFSINALMCSYQQFVGMPYDFKFRFNNKAIYCSELVVRLFQICGPNIRFKKSNVFGKMIYEPSSFLESGDWECLYDSRESGGNEEQGLDKEVCFQ